jgi:hypothetical protein
MAVEMEIVVSVLKAVGAIFSVMALWFLWMTYVRRRSGCRADKDVLEHMTHGCTGCQGGVCHQREAEEEHHELA